MSGKRFTFLLCSIYIGLAIMYIFRPVQLIAFPPAGDLSAFTRALDARMPRFLQGPGVAGASVALVRHGQVDWMKGYGLADIHQRIPVSAHTIFQAASISKTVTAWGVMKL